MSTSRIVRACDASKKVVTSVGRALPGTAKVAAMVGQSIFIADRFTAYCYRTDKGLDQDLGLALAIIFAIGVGVDNFVGRALAMYRREALENTAVSPTSSQGLNPPFNLNPIEIAKKSNCWTLSIDHPTCISTTTYRFLMLICLLYCINSAIGGVLNAFSIGDLVRKFLRLEFDDTCKNQESHWDSLIPLLGFGAFIGFSNVLSFVKTNLARVRENFIRYILNGQCSDFNRYALASVILGFITVSLNTVGIIFNNVNTWLAFDNKILCHMNAKTPEALIIPQGWDAIVTNMLVTSLTTIPAIYKKLSGENKKAIADYLEYLPNFKRMHIPILFCIAISSICFSLGLYISMVKLPESMDHNLKDTDISYSPLMKFIGIISALFALLSQYCWDYDAYANELREQATLAGMINNSSLNESFLPDAPQESRITILDESKEAPKEERMEDLTQESDLPEGLVSSDSMMLPPSDSTVVNMNVVQHGYSSSLKEASSNHTLFSGPKQPRTLLIRPENKEEQKKSACVIM